MSRGARILLVDDLPQNLEIFSGFLEHEGYRLELAQDGQQAVEMALKSPPDLILMDLEMPGIDGWEAARRLKSNSQTQHIPIIALSAHALAGAREKALAAGCDEFDTKPVEFERLVATIRRVLTARK